jgi:murein DD-endopeptidase MepM/ murein hydrolase activator NlpD
MTGRGARTGLRRQLQSTLHARLTRSRVVAALAVLALVPVAGLAGTLSAPAYAASSTDSNGDVTWDDVAAAQASVDATQALVNQLKATLAGLQADVDRTQADATAKGDAYGKAQDAFDNQEYIVETLQTQVDDAQKKADVAKKTAGQMLAALSKTAGSADLTANLLSSSSPSKLLYQMGTYNQISDRSHQVFAKALQLQNSAQALTDKANAAKTILAQYKDAAQAAFEVAQTAAAAASAALQSQQNQEAQLEAKLSVLQEKRTATLADYNATLVAKWGPGAAGVVSSSGWANPANGYLGDRFGMRFHPIYHIWKLHSGQDISGTGCGANIYAAHSGTVTYAGPNGDLGNFIELDNGGGVTTGYGHIIAGGILVSIGQHVGPGQLIAKVGSTGGSTGCHLHFMVRINGALTDPLPFMRDRGVTLG